MAQVDITVSTPKPWTAYETFNGGLTWNPWYTDNAARQLYRLYISDLVKTIPQGGVYTKPTNYKRYLFAISGTPSDVDYGIDDWPYEGSYSTHRRRGNVPPISSNYAGSSDGSVEYYGVNPVSLVPSVSAGVVSRARSLLFSKIRNEDFDLGQSIGELPESFGNIRDSVKKAKKHMQKLKSASGISRKQKETWKTWTVAQLRKAGSQAATTYLEYIFGFLPLMNSIYDAFELIEEGLANARLTATVDLKDELFGPPVPNLINGKRTYKGTFIRGIKESATLGLISPESFKLWRLGLVQPFAIAWELLSLSFVVDWFLHIGPFLSGLYQPLGTNYLHGYSTKYVDANFTAFTKQPYLSGSFQYFVKEIPTAALIRSKGFSREVLISLVPPLPYFSLGINRGQLTSLVALAASMAL